MNLNGSAVAGGRWSREVWGSLELAPELLAADAADEETHDEEEEELRLNEEGQWVSCEELEGESGASFLGIKLEFAAPPLHQKQR